MSDSSWDILPKGISVTHFGLMWLWLLTSWPPKLTVSCPCPADHLCQSASKSVLSCLNYHVHKFGNGQTDWRTDEHTRTDGQVANIMPLPANLAWRTHETYWCITCCTSWFFDSFPLWLATEQKHNYNAVLSNKYTRNNNMIIIIITVSLGPKIQRRLMQHRRTKWVWTMNR